MSDEPLDDPLLAGRREILEGRAPRGPGEVAVPPDVADQAGAEVGDTRRPAAPGARARHRHRRDPEPGLGPGDRRPARWRRARCRARTRSTSTCPPAARSAPCPTSLYLWPPFDWSERGRRPAGAPSASAMPPPPSACCSPARSPRRPSPWGPGATSARSACCPPPACRRPGSGGSWSSRAPSPASSPASAAPRWPSSAVAGRGPASRRLVGPLGRVAHDPAARPGRGGGAGDRGGHARGLAPGPDRGPRCRSWPRWPGGARWCGCPPPSRCSASRWRPPARSVLVVYVASLGDVSWGVGLGGAALVLAGGACTTPWLVSRLEPLAARARGGLRVAARGLARNRARSGAVATAIMAPVAVALFVLDGRRPAGTSRRAPRSADDQVLVEGDGWLQPDDVDGHGRRRARGRPRDGGRAARRRGRPGHRRSPSRWSGTRGRRRSWWPRPGSSTCSGRRPGTAAVVERRGRRPPRRRA